MTQDKKTYPKFVPIIGTIAGIWFMGAAVLFLIFIANALLNGLFGTPMYTDYFERSELRMAVLVVALPFIVFMPFVLACAVCGYFWGQKKQEEPATISLGTKGPKKRPQTPSAGNDIAVVKHILRESLNPQEFIKRAGAKGFVPTGEDIHGAYFKGPNSPLILTVLASR